MKEQELTNAELLEQYITNRLIGTATPGPDDSTLKDVALVDAALVDGLVQCAQTIRPDAAFVKALEQRLQAQSAQPPARQEREWWARWPKQFSLWLAPQRLAIATACLVMLLFVGLLALSPAVRAAVREMLYGIGFIDETWVKKTPIPLVEPTINPEAPAPMSLEEIQRRAPFTVQTPGWLPNGLRFTGGFVTETASGVQATLAYHLGSLPTTALPDPAAPLLFLAVSNSEIEGYPLLPADRGSAVEVHDKAAFYVHGSWQEIEALAKQETAQPLQWNEQIDAGWLTWEEDGLTYLLYSQALGLSQAEQIQIAESLR